MNANRLAPFFAVLALTCWLLPGCSADVPLTAPTLNGAGAGPLVGEVATPCVPACDGKACGFDGCFGQCGTCGEGTACDGGQCVAYVCTPNCEGRGCGSNGCGGSCGNCVEGEFCLAATGTCNVADPCGGVTFTGCCAEGVLKWCAATTLETADCEGSCGWDPDIGEYNCGTDGASDPSGAVPKACGGECSCAGKTCGDDGCGESCGDCPAGQDCSAGACVADPCMGITFEGCCDGEVAVWCENGALQEYDCDLAGEPLCGWVVDLGYYCESDGGVDPDAVLPKACNLEPPPDCTPNCTDVACGDDGCGGSCDACEAGLTCELGICVGDACMGITYDGCCDGDVATWCDEGELLTEDCAGLPGSCGWDAESGYFCESDGGEDPGGLPKACPGDEDPCTGLSEEGCCDGQKILWCEGGQLQELKCGPGGGCGWNPAIDEYDCGMGGAEEPTGQHPKACP